MSTLRGFSIIYKSDQLELTYTSNLYNHWADDLLSRHRNPSRGCYAKTTFACDVFLHDFVRACLRSRKGRSSKLSKFGVAQTERHCDHHRSSGRDRRIYTATERIEARAGC